MRSSQNRTVAAKHNRQIEFDLRKIVDAIQRGIGDASKLLDRGKQPLSSGGDVGTVTGGEHHHARRSRRATGSKHIFGDGSTHQCDYAGLPYERILPDSPNSLAHPSPVRLSSLGLTDG